MSTTTKQPPDTCRITIVNEVTGEHRSKVSPCSLSEAMGADGDVAFARSFIEFQDSSDSHIAVCIFRSNARGIIVYWHPTGEIEAARDEWRLLIGKPGRTA